MGLAGGFGDSEAGGALEGDRCRRCEADAMAGGDVDGAHVGAGAQDRADLLIAVEQRRPRASLAAGFLVGSDEAGLGGADCGRVQQHAEVAGDAEAARVGQALAVAEQQVRLPG